MGFRPGFSVSGRASRLSRSPLAITGSVAAFWWSARQSQIYTDRSAADGCGSRSGRSVTRRSLRSCSWREISLTSGLGIPTRFEELCLQSSSLGSRFSGVAIRPIPRFGFIVSRCVTRERQPREDVPDAPSNCPARGGDSRGRAGRLDPDGACLAGAVRERWWLARRRPRPLGGGSRRWGGPGTRSRGCSPQRSRGASRDADVRTSQEPIAHRTPTRRRPLDELNAATESDVSGQRPRQKRRHDGSVLRFWHDP